MRSKSTGFPFISRKRSLADHCSPFPSQAPYSKKQKEQEDPARSRAGSSLFCNVAFLNLLDTSDCNLYNINIRSSLNIDELVTVSGVDQNVASVLGGTVSTIILQGYVLRTSPSLVYGGLVVVLAVGAPRKNRRSCKRTCSRNQRRSTCWSQQLLQRERSRYRWTSW